MLNAFANDARLFPAASHVFGLLNLPLRFRRFRYKDHLFEYCSITSQERNMSRRRNRACLTETSFNRKLQIVRRRLTHAFEIDRPRAFGSFVFTTELNTRVYRWLFLCAGSRGWYLAPYVASTKKSSPTTDMLHGEAEPSAQAPGPWPVESSSLLTPAGDW